MKRLVFLTTLLLSLESCGDKQIFIADRVKFQVSFTKQIVQVSFDMNPQFKIENEKHFKFGSLGNEFLKPGGASSSSIGVSISGKRPDLQAHWPTLQIFSLSNEVALPASVQNAFLNEWDL